MGQFHWIEGIGFFVRNLGRFLGLGLQKFFSQLLKRIQTPKFSMSYNFVSKNCSKKNFGKILLLQLKNALLMILMAIFSGFFGFSRNYELFWEKCEF